LPSAHTSNVLVEAYPVLVAVYLLQYRTEENPGTPEESAFRSLKPRGRLAFCITMAPAVERLARGKPSEGCPLGSFPPDGILSDTFDGFNEEFYAADTKGSPSESTLQHHSQVIHPDASAANHK
jgi:hypothetical protein